MSVATQPRSEGPPVEAEDRPYEVTADQFTAMIEAGVFPEEARVYLRDGRIVEKVARSNAHSIVATLFATALNRTLPAGWFMFVEGQILLDDTNARLPDLAVLRGDPRVFLQQGRYPNAGDLGLAIEIAVTSLAKDLGPNLERYARAMIPTYWVADFPGERIWIHSGPSVTDGVGSYARVIEATKGQDVPLMLDGHEVACLRYDDLMP